MNTPFMKQIRGFGDRVIKAMTPRNTNSIVDGLAPQTSSYSSSTTIPNRTNLNTVSSTVGQALFGAPPLLINSRPVVSTTTTTASTQLPSARPPPTQPPPVTAVSALFGAPPPSSGPATYSTPNPFTSHGPVVFGAPPVSSISTIYNRPPPPVSSGPAVFGAPPRDHTPPPFTAGQALFGAPSSTHIQQRTSWSATPSPTNPFIGGTTAPEVDPFIPDEWINNITANAPAIRNGIRPPKLDLPYFDGNPMDYPMFIQSFKVQIHDTCTSDAERQRHLKNCLSKEIQQRLGQALLNPGLYHYALTELHRKYGHPRIISTACATALASIQSFRDNDFKALSLFSSTLHSVVATLQLGGYGAELHSSSTLSQLVQKLPPGLRSRWAEKSYLIECRLPNIADLDGWLDDVTTAEYCVRAGQSVHPTETNHPASGDRKSNNNNNKKKRDGLRSLATSLEPPSSPCANCSGPAHHIRECRKFQSLNVAQRAAAVVEKSLCYRCLEAGHRSRDCQRKDRCGEDGCKGMHHNLLHGAPRMYPDSKDIRSPPKSESKKEEASKGPATKSILKVHLPDASTESRTVYKKDFTGSTNIDPLTDMALFSQSSDVSLIPIVPVIAIAAEYIRLTLAVLDSCSTVTLVAESLANDLKLSGPADMVRIGTWHADDPLTRTEYVGFQIGNRDGSSIFSLNHVLTVPVLNIRHRKADWDRLVEK